MKFSIILVDISERCVRNCLSYRLYYHRKIIFLIVQVFRVLKFDAIFVYVTYRQPHFMKTLLNCAGVDWDIQIDILGSSESSESSESSFEYYGFVLRKVIPPVVESTKRETE